MPALSFRTKLLLAMMLVVVGVTAATLSVSQHYFQQSYRSLFNELFQAQNQGFTELQQILLNSVQQTCQTIVGSRRVQLAMREALDGGDPSDLYQRVASELETRQALQLPDQPANPLRARFFLLLDAQGKIIRPPPNALGDLKPIQDQSTLTTQLIGVRQVIQAMEEHAVGFLTPTDASGQPSLHLAVFSPIIDTPTGDTLGALALGFPFRAPETNPQAVYSFRGGVWLENHLFATQLPQPILQDLAPHIPAHRAQPEPDGHLLTLAGEPHRMFAQALFPNPHLPQAQLISLFPLGSALQAQRNLRDLIVLFGVAGLVGALLVSLLLSHGLSGPIRDLVAGTLQVRQGNFKVHIPVRSRDELGRLTDSFNEMTVGLAQKEQYRSVLDKVADKAVAEELLHGRITLGGENRRISVLFCDIRGFTALTQNMDPAEVIRMLNEHFTPLTRVVNQHGGVVDKFVGDLIMAVFGAPKSYGDDSLSAARCALAMIHERHALNQTSQYQIEMGIGLASGNAVAGCMGSVDRLNYTVLGERVNLASRLCGKAARMEIVIDQETHRLLGSKAKMEPLPDMDLKGFSDAIHAYKLLATD